MNIIVITLQIILTNANISPAYKNNFHSSANTYNTHEKKCGNNFHPNFISPKLVAIRRLRSATLHNFSEPTPALCLSSSYSLPISNYFPLNHSHSRFQSTPSFPLATTSTPTLSLLIFTLSNEMDLVWGRDGCYEKG